MKYKLIIDPIFLKKGFESNLNKTLLVVNEEKVSTIKELLEFIHTNYSFAFNLKVKYQLLYLTTADDFTLPPNGLVKDTLSPNEIIKLNSVKVHEAFR